MRKDVEQSFGTKNNDISYVRINKKEIFASLLTISLRYLDNGEMIDLAKALSKRCPDKNAKELYLFLKERFENE